MSNEQPLKQALIHSLTCLGKESVYSTEINEIVEYLRKGYYAYDQGKKRKKPFIIPDNDYENIIKLVITMVQTMPGILERNPHDQALKTLLYRCARAIEENITHSFNKNR